MAIYIQHIQFKYAGHRTLICTSHRPWWLTILFWVKPLRVDYIGHSTRWQVVLGRHGSKLITDPKLVPTWLANKLQHFENAALAERQRKKNSSIKTKLLHK